MKTSLGLTRHILIRKEQHNRKNDYRCKNKEYDQKCREIVGDLLAFSHRYTGLSGLELVAFTPDSLDTPILI